MTWREVAFCLLAGALAGGAVLLALVLFVTIVGVIQGA